MPEKMREYAPASISGRKLLPERMPSRISEYLPESMPDRISEFIRYIYI
jgi:hypothetical protein